MADTIFKKHVIICLKIYLFIVDTLSPWFYKNLVNIKQILQLTSCFFFYFDNDAFVKPFNNLIASMK